VLSAIYPLFGSGRPSAISFMTMPSALNPDRPHSLQGHQAALRQELVDPFGFDTEFPDGGREQAYAPRTSDPTKATSAICQERAIRNAAKTVTEQPTTGRSSRLAGRRRPDAEGLRQRRGNPKPIKVGVAQYGIGVI
jgi:hypothetical protein